MVYMADTADGECARCEDPKDDLSTHTIHFFDDRDSRTVDLCPPCVRMVRESDNGVRSIV